MNNTTSRLRKYIIGLVIVSSAFLFTGCFEGYIPFSAGLSDKQILWGVLDPDDLNDYLDNPVPPDLRLIDVRVVGYNLGHIPTAESFPSSEIMSRLIELPKEDYLVVYCETGVRAQAVISQLEAEGYTRVMNWGAGIRWSNAGYSFVN